MKAWMLLAAVLGGMASGELAAQSPSGMAFARYTKPLRRAYVDLDTGTVTRRPAVQQRVGTTISEFPNLDLGGFIGADTGAGFCRWIDAGVKGVAGNTCDLMHNFFFAYCSATLAVESGGVGGSTTIGFYEGYTVGGGSATTAVALVTLSGLPANTANSSPFIMGGGTNCYIIGVQFPTLVPFADGPIGYSWLFRDLDQTGVFGSTIPFLSCVQSCSGPGPDGLGMIDVIDEYCPPGFLLSTFSFGTTQTGSYFTSMSMDIHEVVDVVGTVIHYNSTSPPNLDFLTSNAIVVGTTWTATCSILHPAHTGPGFSYLLVRGSHIPGNGAPAGVYGRLLVTGAFLANFIAPHAGPGFAATFNIAVPLSFGIVGQTWAAQAASTGSGIRLSSGVRGLMGTI